MLANGRVRVPRSELEALLDTTEKSHREALDSLLSHYGLSTESGNVHLFEGRPGEIISGYASEKGNDLIVMGTLGRTGIAGLFIGNTAEDVLRETQSAVLTIKPDDFVTPIE
jgi:nucleotide-binding universal stress UspA family protein